MTIYMATNKINGKRYIGQTIQSLNLRKKQHVNRSNNKKSIEYNTYFHKALRLFGKNNFHWEILRECNSIEELNMYEADYIGLYNTYNCGYNLTYGGRHR